VRAGRRALHPLLGGGAGLGSSWRGWVVCVPVTGQNPSQPSTSRISIQCSHKRAVVIQALGPPLALGPPTHPSPLPAPARATAAQLPIRDGPTAQRRGAAPGGCPPGALTCAPPGPAPPGPCRSSLLQTAPSHSARLIDGLHHAACSCDPPHRSDAVPVRRCSAERHRQSRKQHHVCTPSHVIRVVP
jgi:hypothetical protein